MKLLILLVIATGFLQPVALAERDVQLTIRKCGNSNLQNVDVVRLPTSFINTTGQLEFSMETHSLLPGNDIESCRPQIMELPSITILRNSSKKSWRQTKLLLENGYLSVANLSDESVDYYGIDEYCIADVHGSGENRIADIKICIQSSSTKRPVLNKCCPLGTILGIRGCVKENDHWEPTFMDFKTLPQSSAQNMNPVYHCPLLSCPPAEREQWLEDGCDTKFYPVNTGKTAFIGRYRTWEILEHPPGSTYCYDRHKNEKGIMRNILVMCNGNVTNLENGNKNPKQVTYLYMICMYIGAVFHLLTTLVYLITWRKQNVYGKTLCSCTLALFFMQTFLGTAHLLGIFGGGETRGSTFCFLNGVFAQYFFIASFTWLLLLNINLWWSFRSIEGNNVWERNRFLLYTIAGWGFPLIVTGISVILDLTNKCRASGVPTPEYGTHTCFIAAWALGYYIYYIIAVLMTITFIFAVITLGTMVNYQKATSNLGANKRAENMRTFILFLKLSVVMGLSWIFELISWVVSKEDSGGHWIWTIFDVYNMLSAILIFILFVCQRKTLSLLQEVHPAFNVLTAEKIDFSPTFRRKDYSSTDATTRVDD
ncbi:G-protein coupled receptor Mth [Orchesella cincta]|uniref:G-protein coupled receptor Mth n=1 Tax=Orchesella cincta TaxID=48709 RepID=A0A1D2MEC2_ORCCI|nr:G-protein coupled receptor Mth [Orchesella cincta]